MVKKTVYLPLDLKRRLVRTAQARRCSQAAIVRMALEEYIGAQRRASAPMFQRKT